MEGKAAMIQTRNSEDLEVMQQQGQATVSQRRDATEITGRCNQQGKL